MTTIDQHPKPTAYEFLLARYRDVYKVAASIVQLGQIIKLIAFLVVAVAIVAAIRIIAEQSGFETGLSLGLAIFGALAGAALFGLGVMMSACGQLLRALVDTSVNTSPLLIPEEKGAILSAG
jgi:choline-glycine betaine transporter